MYFCLKNNYEWGSPGSGIVFFNEFGPCQTVIFLNYNALCSAHFHIYDVYM